MVNARSSGIDGQAGLADGLRAGAASLIVDGSRDGMAALAELNWKSAAAVPPTATPPTTAARFVMTIVARTKRHYSKSVRITPALVPT